MVSLAQLTQASQTSGKQPSFIVGSFPGATWDTFDTFSPGYGVLLPYNVNAADFSANLAWAVQNNVVSAQYSALIGAAEAAAAAANTTVKPPAVSGGSRPTMSPGEAQILAYEQGTIHPLLVQIANKLGA